MSFWFTVINACLLLLCGSMLVGALLEIGRLTTAERLAREELVKVAAENERLRAKVRDTENVLRDTINQAQRERRLRQEVQADLQNLQSRAFIRSGRAFVRATSVQ